MRLLRLRFPFQIDRKSIGGTIRQDQSGPRLRGKIRRRGMGREAMHENRTPGLSLQQDSLRRVYGLSDFALEKPVRRMVQYPLPVCAGDDL